MRFTIAATLLLAIAIPTTYGLDLAQDDPAQPKSPPTVEKNEEAADQPAPAAPPADAGKDDPETKDADNPETTDKPPSAARPKAKVWKQTLAEWKEHLSAMRKLHEEYFNAQTEDLDRIRKEYDGLRTQGAKKLADLKKAAREAFVEAPNEDRELSRFLVQLSAQAARGDRYEQAYQAAQFFIENGGEDRAIYNWMGISAYGTNRLDEAKKYLEMAHKSGSLTPEAEAPRAGIDDALATWPAEQEFRAAEAEADDLPRVLLKTTKGDILLELFENEAPDTVGNYISLVEKGFYDGREFFRVIPGFMAQVGSPTDDGKGGPGYNIYCEVTKTPHRNHFAGSLSMAKTQARDTGGSQFFLTFAPRPQLNGLHTVFGRVIEGMDVLADIQKFNADEAKPGQPKPKFDKIIEATVVRKREHEYVPNKVK